MGNSNLKTTNDVLVKVDHNNLIYIDPNSVLVNGVVEPRAVEPENLMIYVNLEADLIPRTVLLIDNEKNSLLSIAGGSLNFLQNKNGQDYDTDWTEAYITDLKSKDPSQNIFQTDTTAQSFGIQSISIQVKGANFIPRVNITFIDVRGKTLFESPENSPYKAFFHIPWPIFYLTVKGYYGKAIRYRLHLIKFSSRYNPTNGNFEIDCNFVGSTYAYLADISLEAILNAPYFYATLSSEPETYNEKTGVKQKLFSKTSKGYRILKSIYQEYINKGLLPVDFPVRTLREVIITASRLDKILQDKIYNEIISPTILAGVKEYEDVINKFETAIKEWKGRFLSPEILSGVDKTRIDPITGEQELIEYHKVIGKFKGTLVSVTGTTDHALENIISDFTKKLEENISFGTKVKPGKSDIIKTKSISCNGLKDIKKFYLQKETIGVDIDGVLDQIYVISRDFIQQRNKLENDLEGEMNNFIKNDKDFGLGFEPTIRNIIGVILANAETYIRLMKDVHQKAFDASPERKKKLSGIDTDNVKADDMIYPWPEIKAITSGGKEMVLLYPASKELTKKLNADNKILWPEVEFIENFYDISLRRNDTVATQDQPDKIDYIFDSKNDTNNEDIGVLTNMMGQIPYTNKSYSSILYEIYERAKYITSLNPFSNDAIQELSNIEFFNLKNQLTDDIDVISMLKNNIKFYSSTDTTNTNTLLYNMQSASAFDRYPYYEDQLPTVQYIKDGLDKDFSVTKYVENTKDSKTNNVDHTKVSDFINNYQPEDYRNKIYPFNSSTYLSYLGENKTEFKKSDLQLNGVLKIETPDDFFTSPKSGDIWIKTNGGFTSNLFQNTVKIGGYEKHILNTPYFHRQLYTDFTKTWPQEKYVGSAYLLLNSLPFIDLDETVEFDMVESSDKKTRKSVLASTIFREIASSHFIPYHMMLKWGSIYHRYKKWINEGVDIIADVTDPIDGSLFFDAYSGLTYTGLTGSGDTIYRGDEEDVGFHPYYDNIFHQIVNGYAFFDTNDMVYSYSLMISSGVTKLYYQEPKGSKSWTSFIDNSKFDVDDETYTLLPCNGYNNVNGENFIKAEQENFRSIWNIGTSYTNGDSYIDYSGYTFPVYNEYFRLTGTTDTYSLGTNYRKVIDLIATFKSDILDTFELAFLDFASEKLNEEIPYKPYDVTYAKFQDLLKKIVSVSKDNVESTDTDKFLTALKTEQLNNLVVLTNEILSPENLIRLVMANPREVNDHVFGGFTGIAVKRFSTGTYDASQLTPENQSYIELYLGEDIDSYYSEFFSVNDIELNEENIKQFRPLIYIYAGWRKDVEPSPTKASFITYISDNILLPQPWSIGSIRFSGPLDRLNIFLVNLIGKIQSNEFNIPAETGSSYIKRGYNEDPIKLELYNYFKSFNDKWTSGNSIGQRTLMEEFMFLDKANRDIGDSVYLDITRLLRLEEPGNEKINLFSAISLVVQDSGFDIRALPAYVNFYGTNFASTSRIIPSKTVAKNMFGAFLDVDVQESSPKIILQYIGPTSKHLEMSDINNKYKYKDDGYDIGNTHKNPIIVAPEVFTKQDFSKSNKVVAFEVSFGDQNQSIFKTVELDQSSIRNTSESFQVLENMGRGETGQSTAQVDIGLWDIYRQSSYQCQVTCMGNMMIQPTMYFYLKNIPLFRGSFWITEVTHDIKLNGIETIFKGTRIPSQSLPNPADSFLASYRTLFDKMIKRAVVKVNEEHELSGTTGTEKIIVNSSGSHIYEVPETPPGIKVVQESGITAYGIPYNGYNGEKYITKVIYEGSTAWLYAKVIQINGDLYKIPDDRSMSILSRRSIGQNILWRDIKDKNGDYYFAKFDLNSIRPDQILDNFIGMEFAQVRSLFSSSGERKQNRSITVTVNTSIDYVNKLFTGPISIGPDVEKYGIALSRDLMRKLKLSTGDYVLFRMV